MEARRYQYVTVLEAIAGTDPQFYPYIYWLFEVFVTYPVTVASCERSFSKLRRLNAWLETLWEKSV